MSYFWPLSLVHKLHCQQGWDGYSFVHKKVGVKNTVWCQPDSASESQYLLLLAVYANPVTYPMTQFLKCEMGLETAPLLIGLPGCRV